jgi:hypothetical protein
MEFVCADPRAMVRAANVRATLDAFSLVPSIGKRIIARHTLELAELKPDKFVPVQAWLDALKEIQKTVGTGVVRDVGSRIIENADFPPQFATVERILESLDAIYHMNHRGEVGHYHFERRDDAFIVRCETPYPRHFEYGLIEGICRNRAVGGGRYLLSFDAGPADSDLTCTVTVRPRGSPTRPREIAVGPRGSGGSRRHRAQNPPVRRRTRQERAIPG